MDYSNDFHIDINKWAKPLNIYTDGVVKNIVNDIRSVIGSTESNDIYKVIPFGSQYYDNAVSPLTPLDIYVLNTSEYYFDVSKDVDVNKLNIEKKDIDYKNYKHKLYKDIQKHFKKQNVGLGDTSISIKKQMYGINLIAAYSYRAYQNVIDKNGNSIVSFIEGLTFFDKNDNQIINYPFHDEKNYFEINLKTDYRFNSIVRVFKNLSNWISRKEGYSTMMSSYLINCLIYNNPNTMLKRMIGYDEMITEIVNYLFDILNTDLYRDMYEINDIKLLFSSKQKWDKKLVLNFLSKCREYMKYIS